MSTAAKESHKTAPQRALQPKVSSLTSVKSFARGAGLAKGYLWANLVSDAIRARIYARNAAGPWRRIPTLNWQPGRHAALFPRLGTAYGLSVTAVALQSGVADFRMLLAFEGERLAGVIAHRLDLLVLESGKTFYARKVHVIAVGSEYRGVVFEDDSRLSDRLISTMIEDVAKFSEGDIFTAIVANENDRSMEMFERCGEWSQVAYDAAHTRLTGRFTL